MMIKQIASKHLTQAITSFICGALTTLAFAPWEYWWLAPLTLSILFALQRIASTPKQSGWLGFSFGLGFFGTGVSWVFISISRFGTQDNLLAGLLTSCLIGYCACYPGVAGWLTKKLSKHCTVILTVTIWWLTEYLRGILFTGFPWLVLGVSQTNSPLGPLAHYIGANGLSAIILLVASLMSRCWHQPKHIKNWLIAGLVLLISLLSGLKVPHTPTQIPKDLSISLIQANIPQTIKWQPGKLEHIVNTHLQLTQDHWDSDLVIWPEGALPGLIRNHIKIIDHLNNLALQHHTTLILGTLSQHPDNGKFFNTLLALGEHQGIYYKRHLVPFGEYTPLAIIFSPLAKRLHIPQSLLSPGPMHQPLLDVGKYKIAPFICYEIAYTNLVKASSKQADILLVIADDSWFGDSIANAQHLQIAKMRAIEIGKPLIFSSNTTGDGSYIFRLFSRKNIAL